MREAAEPVDENQQQQPQPAGRGQSRPERSAEALRQVLVLGVVAAAFLKLPFSSSSVTQNTKFFWRGVIDLFDCGLRLQAPGRRTGNGVNLVTLTQHFCDEENAVDRVTRRRGWC